jgi:hypothetical protein
MIIVHGVDDLNFDGRGPRKGWKKESHHDEAEQEYVKEFLHYWISERSKLLLYFNIY